MEGGMGRGLKIAAVIGVLALAYSAGAMRQGAIVAPAQAQVFDRSTIPALNKQLWAYIVTPVGDGSRQEAFLKDHLAYQAALEKSGVMYGAGPLAEVGGKSRGGLIIVRAATAEEAKKIADADPMHINGARTYKLYQWTLNEGLVSVKLNLSQGTFKFD
jgi:uncharacterized protein